jgi:hypothetical protein
MSTFPIDPTTDREPAVILASGHVAILNFEDPEDLPLGWPVAVDGEWTKVIRRLDRGGENTVWVDDDEARDFVSIGLRPAPVVSEPAGLADYAALDTGATVSVKDLQVA